jgi:dienelactone hydrolase
MAELLLFHHACGLTRGLLAFADDLRTAGHVVHTPDVYDGRTFSTLTDGLGYAEQVGFPAILDRGHAAADRLPTDLVYVGMSLGVMPAQMLAQTRPGARGAVLLHASVPLSEFGGVWPAGLPLQIHTMQSDELGDVDVARQLDETIDSAELFLYPGSKHLFTDASLPDYDASATALVKQRLLSFLSSLS